MKRLLGGTGGGTGGGGGGSGTPGGSTTQVQFNDAGAFAGDADLTWNKTTNVMTVTGDVNLSDGGTYTTTLQTITPTAARTISLPDATGTVALVAGSSGQLLWNNAGVNAGASTLTYDGSILTSSGRFINSYNATASSPAKAFTGTWFTGGTGTTTKPQVLIEPTGATSTAWSTSGTGLGVNAASGFAGRLLDLQVNGSSRFYVDNAGGNAAAYLVGSSTLFLDQNSSNGVILGNYAGYGLFLGSNTQITWNNGSPQSTRDLTLVRDAANTLAQRNGTNAQTYRVYNTFTDASNYQRTSLTDSSTGLVINQEFAGTGAARTNLLDLQVNGTSVTRITSGGNAVITAGSRSAPGLQFSGATAHGIWNDSTTFRFSSNSVDWLQIRSNDINVPSASGYNIGGDVTLTRSAANVFKVTNASTGDGTLLALHRLAGTAPATASSTGTAGDVRYDTDYVYICTATNTWKRAALTTW